MKNKLSFYPALLALVVLLLGMTRPALAFRSHIKISMQMNKQDFRPGEPIGGAVLFNNRSAATARAVFIIRLYDEKDLYKEISTAIPMLLPGKNRYTLDELGCSFLKSGLNKKGVWRLEIMQQNVDNQPPASATFRVIKEKENP